MSEEYRRATRHPIPDTIQVIDTMTERVVGRLGNLSETGMLVIAGTPMTDDALYQLRFGLSHAGAPHEEIEVGAHLLWQHHASAPGQSWAGFRFITLSDAHEDTLRGWLGQPA